MPEKDRSMARRAHRTPGGPFCARFARHADNPVDFVEAGRNAARQGEKTFAPSLTQADELGRVVIPKEIRRTLRIREGDPLEIYTDKDGEVILKKYSPIGEISNFAKDYTESLFRSLGHIACITDKDMIVSASGVSRKELWEKPISRDLEQAIQSRQVVTANRGSGTRLVPVTSEDDAQAYTAQVICPIIADGESIGAVVLLSREPAAKMGDTELKVAETTASIVGRQMEQ